MSPFRHRLPCRSESDARFSISNRESHARSDPLRQQAGSYETQAVREIIPCRSQLAGESNRTEAPELDPIPAQHAEYTSGATE